VRGCAALSEHVIRDRCDLRHVLVQDPNFRVHHDHDHDVALAWHTIALCITLHLSVGARLENVINARGLPGAGVSITWVYAMIVLPSNAFGSFNFRLCVCPASGVPVTATVPYLVTSCLVGGYVGAPLSAVVQCRSAAGAHLFERI
jgi:hypothetical protein